MQSIPQKERKVNLNAKLPRDFFARETLRVARELLGKRLVRFHAGERLSGVIVEVEAYVGENDQSSHARPGLTARNAPMYGPPGLTYVYLIYGMHHCLNLVTEREGYPAAVLIRALEPREGQETQHRLRGTQTSPRDLTRGPGRLCAALAIDRALNALDLCADDAPLWVEDAPPIPEAQVSYSPRIGVRGDARAVTAPWRFYLHANPWISGAAAFNRDHAKTGR